MTIEACISCKPRLRNGATDGLGSLLNLCISMLLSACAADSSLTNNKKSIPSASHTTSSFAFYSSVRGGKNQPMQNAIHPSHLFRIKREESLLVMMQCLPLCQWYALRAPSPSKRKKKEIRFRPLRQVVNHSDTCRLYRFPSPVEISRINYRAQT